MEFTVLPDGPAGAAPARDLGTPRRIDHGSGRPWILGDWPAAEATVVEAGTRRLVLLGRTRLDPQAARAALGRMRSLHDVDALASRLPGAWHLLVSIDGSTRIQGSVSGARQVFTTVVDGVTVAASAVAPLLALVDAGIDETLLAASLLAPGGAPWPIVQRPVRRGIDPLRTGCWLRLDADGGARQIRWWRLPEASLPLAQGAQALGAALTEAIDVRVGAAGRISADLSGGLDATSLCFLADAAGADLITYHIASRDAFNVDQVWARRAAARLPGARHHTFAADRAQNLFDVGYSADRPNPTPEGPANWASGLPHIRDLAERARAEGSGLHLSGLGGDELFGRFPACAWSLLRTGGLRGLRAANRYRLANRWPLGATVRGLADRSGFAEHLRAAAARLDAPPPLPDEPTLGWVSEARLPPWTTPEAVAAVRRLLISTAGQEPEPLDADRTRHQVLAAVVWEGATIRQINTFLGDVGISWDAPYLDDRVVAAALATRIDGRLAGGRFKPLLTEAVRPVVPDEILTRQDKGEYSAESFRGLEHNRARLLELCEDSRLARLGLIDPVAFREGLLSPGPMTQHLAPIFSTVAAEGWLRSHTGRTARADRPRTAGEPR